MFSLDEILELQETDKRRLGVMYTPSEINQQPEIWEKTVEILSKKRIAVKEFINTTGILTNSRSNIIITGAGTSEFVGNSAAGTLQKELNIPVDSVSSTDFIIYPERFLLKGWTTILVSVARSGDSPESIATYKKAKIIKPDIYQLVITCNSKGTLAEEARKDNRSFLIVLPDETNDRGLAMTSSFSSMVLSLLSLIYLDSWDEFHKFISLVSDGSRNILRNNSGTIRSFVAEGQDRILYLGSGELKGAAQESRLKVLEMTDGKIVSDFNSYVGLRHGPQVFADENTLVIAFISGDMKIQQYELDLLKEMQEKNQGKDYLFVCQKENKSIKNLRGSIIEILPNLNMLIPNSFRVLTDIIVGQLVGLFKSLQFGLKPDTPSETGTINRIVEGITVYGVGYDD